MTEIITVTADNVEEHGFFCKMSARKTSAWQAKRDWLKDRFAEGMTLLMLGDKQRGFVEFMPGNLSWRAIDDARDLMVIHCLWVVGKSKGQGFARELLNEAERAAKERGYNGLAVLASTGNWLAKPELFTHFGFQTVEEFAPFSLMVKRFAKGPTPRLSGNWVDKAAACGPGITVLRTAQCPYLEDATGFVREFAETHGIEFADVILASAEALRSQSPTPYGVYAVVQDGTLRATHYLLKKDLPKVLSAS